jgi:hypothetical protein
MATTFSNKVAILADLYINHKDNQELADFVEYNDLGLPLAYFIYSELVDVNDKNMEYINQTFDLLCNGLEHLDLEKNYSSLQELME